MSIKQLFATLLLLMSVVQASAQDRLDDIERLLDDAPVQEKVYLHLDNNCYYKGDDIWFKAYVVRADNHRLTDMSRLLYVELVSPDGMLVERQTIVVNDKGGGEGSFNLSDSLYSGYYELRAYTRWMMNFCVTEHPSNRQSRELFYNRQMAQDFFRLFGTVYSRVVPVYERPEERGDYSQKTIITRPKTRVNKDLDERLVVNFFPEGGHLIAGTRATVAFEAVDEEGRHVDIAGSIGDLPIATEHEGRGCFTIDVPADRQLKATFHYEGKEYTFSLPKAELNGCALHLTADDSLATVHLQLPVATRLSDHAVAVLSRGRLKVFQRFRPDEQQSATITISKQRLPSGVSDLIVIDPSGQPMADRLFFVDHHDVQRSLITVATDSMDYNPYQPISVTLTLPNDQQRQGAQMLRTPLSVSVRDAATVDATFDTSNLLTELLLSSELRGFIPHAHQYFESDDSLHRHRLDLLLMVQGWRRYDYSAIVADEPLRYAPEQGLTVEGCVYPTVDTEDYTAEEVSHWPQGVFGYTESRASQLNPEDPLYKELNERISRENQSTTTTTTQSFDQSMELVQVDQTINLRSLISRNYNTSDMEYNLERGGLKHEVVVECELVQVDEHMQRREGTTIMGAQVETVDGGHFLFRLPPFAGEAILFLRAFDINVSDRHKRNIDLKGRFSEESDPDYYVKRSMFYPVFARKYSYYQWHYPEDDAYTLLGDTLDASADGPLSSMDRTLQELTVSKRRRRGRRSIDYTKPAAVYDAQQLYNLATDYGLSYGKFDMQAFPVAVSTMLLGTYNERRFFNVSARYNDGVEVPYVFYQNFSTEIDPNVAFLSAEKVRNNLRLARLDDVRVFTDFELRNDDRPIVMQNDAPDVTLEFRLMPNDTKRYVYRDRRLFISGITLPDAYYQPDYSRRQPLPDDWYDYRRTLYWNPSVQPDADGRLRLHLYNNGKRSRIEVSACGITDSGEVLVTP